MSSEGKDTVARIGLDAGEEAPVRDRYLSTDSIASDGFVPQQEAQLANTHLEHLSLLDIFSQPHIVRNTGIICTIGELKVAIVRGAEFRG